MASGIPGVSRWHTARVASGVTSRGEKPVPPVVTIRFTGCSSHSARRAASMRICSSGTTRAVWILYPADWSISATRGPPASGRSPRKLRSLTVMTAAVNIRQFSFTVIEIKEYLPVQQIR